MKQLGSIVALALLAGAASARAECPASTQLSTCIDVDTLWPHAGAARFTFVGGATTALSGQGGVALVTTYLTRPLVLQVPSTSALGVEVPAIDRLWDTTLLGSIAVAPRVELLLAVPFTTYRSGTGISALSSQRTAELSRTALRDVRVGAAFALAESERNDGWGRALLSRVEVALPVGESTTFAGDRFLVLAPSFSGELSYARFVFAAELGARVRGRSELAGSRMGTQIVASIGGAAKLLRNDALSVQLEAVTLPTLTAQHELTHVNGARERAVRGSRPRLVPTEWQFSLRAMLGRDTSASLGAGGSLALTGEYGITSPAYRVVFALRYAPSGARP